MTDTTANTQPQWKDTTGYSRGDTERVPTTWSLDTGDIRITVTCGHLYYKGSWVMHCDPWFNTYPLKIADTATAIEAQRKALSLVRQRITTLVEALNNLGE